MNIKFDNYEVQVKSIWVVEHKQQIWSRSKSAAPATTIANTEG